MDLRSRRPSGRRGARADDLAAAATGRGWADVSTVTLGTAFAPTMAGLVAVHVAAALADVVIFPGALLLPLVAMTVAAPLALLGIAHLRRPRTGTVLRTMLGLAFALTTADAAAHVVVGSDPMFTVFLTPALVAAGAMVPAVRWLLVSDVLAVVALVLVVVPRLSETQAQQALSAVLLALVVAHLLQRHAHHGRHQLQVLASALARGALTDPLTGLSNRQGLAHGLERLLTTGSPPGAGVAALCFDVDGFKAINDQLGHATGDAVLVEIGQRLRELVREDDVVARLGGDEFALVLADTTPARAALVVERARLLLRGDVGGVGMPWSVSVGTACSSAHALDSAEDLLRRADLDMYVDKRARRAVRTHHRDAPVTSAPPP